MPRQAITVRYLPATNTKGSRLKAECERGSITVSYDNASHDPKREAVRALLEKLLAEDAQKYGKQSLASNPWRGPWDAGELRDGTHVYVLRPVGPHDYLRIDSIGGNFLEDIK